MHSSVVSSVVLDCDCTQSNSIGASGRGPQAFRSVKALQEIPGCSQACDHNSPLCTDACLSSLLGAELSFSDMSAQSMGSSLDHKIPFSYLTLLLHPQPLL